MTSVISVPNGAITPGVKVEIERKDLLGEYSEFVDLGGTATIQNWYWVEPLRDDTKELGTKGNVDEKTARTWLRKHIGTVKSGLWECSEGRYFFKNAGDRLLFIMKWCC